MNSPLTIEDNNFNESENIMFKKITRLHLIAAIFMGIQIIGYSVAGADVTVNPTIGFPKDCQDGPICSPNMKILKEHNPTFLIILFVALASFDHFITWLFAIRYPNIAMKWLFKIQSNPFRWIEYSISASIMAVAISILSGVHDVHLWFLILLMHSIGMFLGYIIEIIPHQGMDGYDINSKLNSSYSNLRQLIYIISSISIFTPWLVIFCYFFHATSTSSDDVPDFVYAAFLGTFILFLTFGINSYLCHIQNKYSFVTAEMIYIILSFTAKTFLAADVFGGLNASNNDDD